MCRSVWAPHLLVDRGAGCFGLKTRWWAWSRHAAAYALSFKAGKAVSTNSADTLPTHGLPASRSMTRRADQQRCRRIVELTETKSKPQCASISTTSTTSPKARRAGLAGL